MCVVRVTCVLFTIWHRRAGYPASNLKRFLKQGATRIYILWGQGQGWWLVAHVLWRYCMRLASPGVGGVRRVRLALLLYVGRGVWGGWIGHRVPSEG